MDANHTVIAVLIGLKGQIEKGAFEKVWYALCGDDGCSDCSAIVCPYHEPLHFHHDGCPACNAPT